MRFVTTIKIVTTVIYLSLQRLVYVFRSSYVIAYLQHQLPYALLDYGQWRIQRGARGGAPPPLT